MSQASYLPYKLRPNKAVDRELFLSLLNRLSATLKVEGYRYVGLGGPFLEDFRLLHARIGIDDMVCLEVKEAVHLRQKFNRPVERIDCQNCSVEEYLESTEFDKPVVLWLDYSDPREVTRQIETFVNQVIELPIESIIRITLNANPSSLGNPDLNEVSVTLPGEHRDNQRPTVQEWRLDRFKDRLGDFCPHGLSSDGMTQRNFGLSLLNALYLAAERQKLGAPDRDIVWALSTHYSDGQPMVTATVIVVSSGDVYIKAIVEEWAYFSTPQTPQRLDLPVLSTIERLTMESCEDPRERMDYDLPISDIGEDPITNFKKYYRVFPHFARIDL